MAVLKDYNESSKKWEGVGAGYISNDDGTNKATPNEVRAMKDKIDGHAASQSNPHATNKSDVGLGNVENIKQASKAEHDALDTKVSEHLADGAVHGIGDKTALKTTHKASIVGAMNELFTNVSEGKQLIATALTDKGVTTSSGDTFIDMANNIRLIKTGSDGWELYIPAGTSAKMINWYIDLVRKGSTGKLTIYFGEGEFGIDSPIYVKSPNTHLVGKNTVLKCTENLSASNGYPGIMGLIHVGGASKLENVSIRDFTIDGNMDNGGVCNGIDVNNIGFAQTTGLTTGNASRYDSTTVGSAKENKIGITIENCVVANSTGSGIYLLSSANNTITSNSLQNNSSNGIHLNSYFNNSTITGNTVQNNSGHGIYLTLSSRNNTITGNTVQNNNSYGIYLISSSNNTITGNTVQNNARDGIYLLSSANNTITSNSLQNNSNNGMHLNSSSNNTITGNTVQNNHYGIILYSSANNNTITGNTVQNNARDGIDLSSTSNNNMIMSNILENNKGGNLTISGTGNISLTNKELL